MRQPILLSLLLAASSAHAGTKYVTTTCTSTSTTTITHISASSTQIYTSAIPIVETPSAVSAPSPSTILVPLSSAGPSAAASLVYTSELAPFPTAASGTGASPPAGTGSASSGSATATGAPITPVVSYKGAAARNTGSLFGAVVAVGAVALAWC